MAMIGSSCSDDKKAEPEPTPVTRAAKAWNLYSSDFITAEDVIVSTDSASINFSKAYLKQLSEKATPQQGDVVSIFKEGRLSYFEVLSAKENGEHYITCSVKVIGLEGALGLLKINMNNVRLSTDVYMDKSVPKRVNNNGEADNDGIINVKAYQEKSQDGDTIFHPMAYLQYAPLTGAKPNADGVVPGTFTGCYIGQLDDAQVANAWWDAAWGVIKTVYKKAKYIINPGEAVLDLVKGVGKTIYDLATKGELNEKQDVISFDHTFSGHSWDLRLEKAADSNYEPVTDMWTEKKFDEPDFRAQAYATLTGHFNAHAGAIMVLDLKPSHVTKFEVGAYADIDLDLNVKLEAGVHFGLSRPIPLFRLGAKEIVFDIGIPIAIVVYNEIILKAETAGEILAFADFDLKYKKECKATLQIQPTLKGSASASPDLPDDFFTFNKAGMRVCTDLTIGAYLRSSWELYSVAGPVFDIGPSVNLHGDGSIFYDRAKNQIDGEAEAKLYVTPVDVQGGGTIGFPPLQEISNWLYEKLSIHTDMLDLNPPFDPFQPIEKFDFMKLLREKLGITEEEWNNRNEKD